jgi:tetratricopeptide (TPR) repeat protein
VDEASFLSYWGRFDELDRFVPRARATLTRIGGDQLLESWLDTAIAIGLEKRKRDAESLVMHQRALALKQRILGNDHWDTALSMGNVAERLRALGRNDEALAQNDEAITRLERALGPRHPDVALHLFNRGEIHLARGDAKLALADYQHALAVWRDALPADHPYLAYALTGIGRALIQEGNDVASAIAPLERALALREVARNAPDLRAETTFALARALWLTGRDRARAVRLGETARGLYDDAHAEERARVEQELTHWRGGDAAAARQRTSAKTSTSPAP